MKKPNSLRMARLQEGLTQFELSLKSKVNRGRISFLENGYCQPKPKERIKLAKALNRMPNEIFPPEKCS